MVKDDSFLEAVAFFVFIFEDEVFKLGILMVLEFEEGFKGAEDQEEYEAKEG